MSVLILGAGGAVGKRMVKALAAHGKRIIAADRMPRLPEQIVRLASETEPGVDVRDTQALRNVMRRHPDVQTVWNLAAPLSVETAMDPKVAEEVTIGGMSNVLQVMNEVGTRRICFTDSIGSFGAMAPRMDCTARWLTENPSQDPGSDYGLQKRGCRELLARFAENGGDPRWAVLPGVLHSEAMWGKGTTEYALEALQAASRGEPYVCPVDPDVLLPMIFVDDLMRGLVALQDAAEVKLIEPERGYAMPGLSFSANQLFAEIRRLVPDFQVTVELDPNMSKFAQLWPDTLSTVEAQRDLGYTPEVGLADIVENVLSAHDKRNASALAAFQAIDADGNGNIDLTELRNYISKFVFLPPTIESRKTAYVDVLVEQIKGQMDCTGEVITMEQFQAWSRTCTVEQLVQDFLDEKKSTAFYSYYP